MDWVDLLFLAICFLVLLGLLLYSAYRLGTRSAEKRERPKPRRAAQAPDNDEMERYCRILDNIDAYGTSTPQKEIDG